MKEINWGLIKPEPDKASEILFNEAEHQYTNVNGDVIPSTTQVLGDTGVAPDYTEITYLPHPMDWYADRGTICHEGLEIYQNTHSQKAVMDATLKATKESEYDFDYKEIAKLVSSGIRLVDDMELDGWKFNEAEKRFLVKKDIGTYAGTIDIVAEDPDGNIVVLDWKTSKDVNKEHYKFQIAAYAERLDAVKGGVIRLGHDGEKATILDVDVPTYREKWNKVLELYFSDMDDAKMKKAVKKIVDNSVDMPDYIAENLEELHTEKKELDKQVKAIGVKITKFKTELVGDTKGINYVRDNVAVKWEGKQTEVIDREAMEAEVNELTDGKYLKKKEQLETKAIEECEKITKTYKVDLDAVILKHTSIKDTGKYVLRVTKKKEKTAKEILDDNQTPLEEMGEALDHSLSEVIKKAQDNFQSSEEPVSEKTPDSAPTIKLEPIKPVDGEELSMKERIHNMLVGKKFDEELERVFWLNAEKIYACEKDSDKMDAFLSDVLDIAEEISLTAIKAIKADLDAGVAM